MTQSRPNVLLVLTDQQRTDSIGAYGSAFAHTPTLDRLAAGGVRCTDAWCTNPVCTPSRGSIFSGLMPGRHGAWNVGTCLPRGVPLLSHYLAARGYHTHYIHRQDPPATPRERRLRRVAQPPRATADRPLLRLRDGA